MWASPQRRILWARLLIPLMAIIGVASVIAGAWLTAVGMCALIVAQVLVYRRAKDEMAVGE
jgi:hypothetical protein